MGRQVIKNGARWRIKKGSNILVHKDSWLPRPDTFKPISPPNLPVETTVESQKTKILKVNYVMKIYIYISNGNY